MKICAFAGAFSIAFTAASIADNHAPDAPEWGMGNPSRYMVVRFGQMWMVTNKLSNTLT